MTSSGNTFEKAAIVEHLEKYDTDGSISSLIEMERETPEAMLEADELAQVEAGARHIRCDVCRALSKAALGRAIGALQQSLKADVLLPRNLARCVEGAGGVAVEAHEALEGWVRLPPGSELFVDDEAAAAAVARRRRRRPCCCCRAVVARGTGPTTTPPPKNRRSSPPA